MLWFNSWENNWAFCAAWNCIWTVISKEDAVEQIVSFFVVALMDFCTYTKCAIFGIAEMTLALPNKCQNQHFIFSYFIEFHKWWNDLFKHFTPHAIGSQNFWRHEQFFFKNVELIYRDTSHICHVYKMYLFVLFGCQASMCMYQWNKPISMCDSFFFPSFLVYFNVCLWVANKLSIACDLSFVVKLSQPLLSFTLNIHRIMK